MEVTRENFEEVLPIVEQSIKEADYIAFDAEFSGKKLNKLSHLLVYCIIFDFKIFQWRYKINEFLTIMIGYTQRLSDKHNEFDSPEDRYQKIKEVVQEFTAI